MESLTRQVIIDNGEWNNSNNILVTDNIPEDEMKNNFVQPRLFTYTFPKKLLDKSEFLKNKLANIAYFRADIEITLKVQATPFSQGALWLFQTPYANQTTQSRRTLNEHLRSLTSFPGVELNLQSIDRSVTMHVPYTCEYQVVDPARNIEIASVDCAVLLPLKADSAAAKATYTTFARFVNVKLYGHAPTVYGEPQRSAILTQSGYNRQYDRTIYTEAGEDQAASKKGLISGVSSTIGKVAGAIGGMGIPTISAIAKPLGWVANAVAGVASMFGFSKPHNLNAVVTYSNLPGRAYTNLEGLDNSVVLGASAENGINATTTTFDTKDEMAISYLASRPYVFNSYTWKKTDLTGKILVSMPISPCNYTSYGKTRFKEKCIFGAPISFAAAMFRWWRGRPKVKFDFAKTQFHQGRLLAQYIPYGHINAPTEEVLSWIIDLSQVDSDGFEVDLPLITRNKWLATFDPSEEGYSPEACGGCFVVSVLNEMISATTVSNEVDFNLWMTWHDFEVNELGTNVKVAAATTYVKSTSEALTLVDRNDNIITLLNESHASPYMKIGHDGDADKSTVTFRNASGVNNIVYTHVGTSIDTQPIPPGQYVVDYGCADGLYFDTDVKGGTIERYHPWKVNDNEWRHLNKGTKIFYFFKGRNFGTNKQMSGIWLRFKDRKQPLLDIMVAAWNDENSTNYSKTVQETGLYKVELSHMSEAGGMIYLNDPLVYNGPQAFCEAGSGYDGGDSSNITTTMGEAVVSLRAITRRFTLYRIASTSFMELDGIALSDIVTLRQSYVDMISYMYRFVAGSVRYKIITSGKQYVILDSGDRRDLSKGATLLDTNAPSHFQDCDLNPVIEIEQPFYSPAENLVICSKTFDSTVNNLSRIAIVAMDGKDVQRHVLKAAGDDMTFTFLVGAPAFFVGPRSHTQ